MRFVFILSSLFHLMKKLTRYFNTNALQHFDENYWYIYISTELFFKSLSVADNGYFSGFHYFVARWPKHTCWCCILFLRQEILLLLPGSRFTGTFSWSVLCTSSYPHTFRIRWPKFSSFHVLYVIMIFVMFFIRGRTSDLWWALLIWFSEFFCRLISKVVNYYKLFL